MKKQQQQQYVLYGVIAVITIAAIAIIISLSNRGVSKADVEYASLDINESADGVTYVLGDPEAPITIVEFADFQCPYCQQYKSEIDKVIEELVEPGLAKFEFRVYPVMGSTSTYYAQLLECVGDLRGAVPYWHAIDELFNSASSRQSGDQAARNLSDKLDIPYAELLQCTTNTTKYDTNLTLGRQTQVQGTPAVRIRYNDGSLQPIGDYTRAGIPFSELKRIVEAANGS
jgi:protein-disulfide isomerase